MNWREIGFCKCARLVATCALLCGVFSAAQAQQTIFNVPTTDVLDKGKVYAELDASFGATDFVRKPMTPEILRNAVAAALSKQARVSEAPATSLKEDSAEPLIQIITMNGFTILDSEDSRQEPNERRFVVKDPSGTEHEVLVQIDEEAVGYVERMTRRELPAESSFCTSQAQRLLGDYLWTEGKVPPTRKLTIKDVDRDELPIAARWQTT